MPSGLAANLVNLMDLSRLDRRNGVAAMPHRPALAAAMVVSAGTGPAPTRLYGDFVPQLMWNIFPDRKLKPERGHRNKVADERILILDDEADMVENCRRILSGCGYQCIGTTDPGKALATLQSDPPDLVLTDLRMPRMDGMELLKKIRYADADTPVIMLTAFATIESAVQAVKQGAFDYVAKPFSMDQLKLTVARALERSALHRENRRMRERLQDMFGLDKIVGKSEALQKVLSLVRRAARSDADIVVMGESGTGKELIANAVHTNSKRASGPFVALDCACLPENLLESELFGYEKGAFTGAVKSRSGLMETAHKGTLFLDEIGELPLGLQVKLLRTLQERQVRRVGGTKPAAIDVRMVSATNRDLAQLVKEGQFREDLFYRLNVITINLPPLRERFGDVALLAHAFLRKLAQQDSEMPVRGINPEALSALDAYSWPGNVRELRNVIERACALTDGEMISLADLPDNIRQPASPITPAAEPSNPLGSASLKDAKGRWLSNFEPSYVEGLLKEHSGNVSQAARAAGVDRKTLYRLMKKYNLT